MAERERSVASSFLEPSTVTGSLLAKKRTKLSPWVERVQHGETCTFVAYTLEKYMFDWSQIAGQPCSAMHIKIHLVHESTPTCRHVTMAVFLHVVSTPCRRHTSAHFCAVPTVNLKQLGCCKPTSNNTGYRLPQMLAKTYHQWLHMAPFIIVIYCLYLLVTFETSLGT